MTEMPTKRTIDEMITHFNKVVSEMDIPRKDKMTLLGMITAIGYESKKQEVVRCKDCKWWNTDWYRGVHGECPNVFCETTEDWFCADGEKK